MYNLFTEVQSYNQQVQWRKVRWHPLRKTEGRDGKNGRRTAYNFLQRTLITTSMDDGPSATPPSIAQQQQQQTTILAWRLPGKESTALTFKDG